MKREVFREPQSFLGSHWINRKDIPVKAWPNGKRQPKGGRAVLANVGRARKGIKTLERLGLL